MRSALPAIVYSNCRSSFKNYYRYMLCSFCAPSYGITPRHAGLLEIAEAIFVANAKRQKTQGIHFFQLYQRNILLAMQLPGWVGFNIRSISEEYCRDLLMLFMGWMLSIELWHGPFGFCKPCFYWYGHSNGRINYCSIF